MEQEMQEKQKRTKYTAEFKLEAVRQVKVGGVQAVVARTLGIPKASLGKWLRVARVRQKSRRQRK
jgi:transposase-like protein